MVISFKNLFASDSDGSYSSRAAELARQKKLADMLIEMSQQEMPVSTAGGITAPVSPYGALAKALTSFGGSYLSGKAAADEAALKKQDREIAQEALKNYYTQPDTKQLALAKGLASPVETEMAFNMPTLPGQIPSNQTYSTKLNLPGVSRAEVETVRGRATTPEEQMQKIAPLLEGGETSRSLYNALMPDIMKRQAEAGEETLPKPVVVDGRLVDGNPRSRTYGKNITEPKPEPVKPPSTRTFKSGNYEVTEQFNPVKNAYEEIARSPIRVAGSGSNQFDLTDEQNNALFGPNGAVTRGLIDPNRINSRTAKIFANAAITNPDLNMVNASGVAALMRNPTFQNRSMVANSLPAVIEIVKDAGKKVDFSDVAFIGKLQAFKKKQLNDPDFINYMTKRNDAVMSIASVMRGVGMSDKAIEQELQAAPETMSPKAFDAWASAQLDSLEPRLRQYKNVTLNTGASSAPGVTGASGPRLTPEQAAKLPPNTPFIGMDGIPRRTH